MDFGELEGIAREALEATCTTPPVDAFSLAHALDVEIRDYPGREPFVDMLRRCIYLPTRPTRTTRQHGHVCHELGHVLLYEHGLDAQDEAAARYLAGALMLPREDLDADLRRSWSLRALRTKHVHASNEMIARRMTQVRSAVATIVDGGRVTARVASPWIVAPPPPRVWELDLVARALSEGEVVADGPSVAKHAGGDRVVLVTCCDDVDPA